MGAVPAQNREVGTQWCFYDSMKYTILKGPTDENELKCTDQDTAACGVCICVNYNCQQYLSHAIDLVKQFSFDVKLKVITVQSSFHIKNIMHLIYEL